MSIFRRVRDIITANLHEMVDRFEEPDVMLRQAIREMEEAIARSLDRAATVVASERMFERQEAEQRAACERWQKRATESLARGDEPAARSALIEKHRSEQLRNALRAERETLQATSEKLKRRISAMRVRLAEARRIELALSARVQATKATESLTTLVGANDAGFARFERMRFMAERADAHAEARLALLDDQFPHSFAGETDPDEAAAVDAELAKLKQQTTGE